MTISSDLNGRVAISIENEIGIISFYHPKSNSLPGFVLSDLADNIDKLANHQGVKVIVLRSEGEGAFCAGASFDELVSIKTFEQGKKFFMGFARVINAARRCPKFILGRIHGKAVGGGVGMISATDYAIAHSSASVKLSELALGIGPFVVGPAVERKIGKSAFCELTINPTEWKDAAWACQKGLYSDVFVDIKELDDRVHSIAQRLAASNPEAMKLLKKSMWEGADNFDELLEKRAEISGKLVLSDYTVEAINRFKSKIRK